LAPQVTETVSTVEETKRTEEVERRVKAESKKRSKEKRHHHRHHGQYQEQLEDGHANGGGGGYQYRIGYGILCVKKCIIYVINMKHKFCIAFALC